MAAIPLDALTPVYGSYPTSLPVSAGANRWAYAFITHGSGTDANPPTTVTRGGVSPTLMVSADDASWDVTCTLALWNEAAIAAGVDAALAISGGAFTAGNQAVFYGSVQAASQVTPTPATAAENGTSGGVSLTRVAGGYTIAVTAHDIQNPYSSTANPSISGQSDFSPTNTTAWGAEASTDETVNFTWANGFARDNAAIVVNFAPAPSGPSIIAVTDPVEDTIVADMDNPEEVGSIAIQAGTVTEVQQNWSSAFLAPDDTRFTITPVDRATLPFLGAAKLRFLDGGAALIVEADINLAAWPGWKAVQLLGLTGADIDHPQSINQFRTAGTPTTADQYMWQELTATNVQIADNDRVTFDAPGTFQLYYWDGTNETMSGPHTFEVDADGVITPRLFTATKPRARKTFTAKKLLTATRL